jgi:hypothetical protein
VCVVSVYREYVWACISKSVNRKTDELLVLLWVGYEGMVAFKESRSSCSFIVDYSVI